MTWADDVTADPRFAHIYTDPRFRLPSRKNTHVTIDKRFTRMLRDDDFYRKASVDRYGRKTPKSRGKEELKRFYRLDDEAENELDGDDLDGKSGEDEGPAEFSRRSLGGGKKYDPARDGGFSTSEDDSSSEEEEAAAVDQDDERFPEIQVEDATSIPMGEVSSRIAVVNLDWDNIRAADLMAVFASFCPSGGRVERVTIYPSEFGKERLAREEVEGPPPELFASKDGRSDDKSLIEDTEDEEDDEMIKKSLLQEDKGEEVDNTKLRRYQLERLRYYYAVLTISSPETAKALYDATDGTEYLTTANFFDLRFVPDDVSFEDDRPHDECTSIPEGYKPNSFVTDALQHSKVKLTWDAEDNVRKEVVRKAFGGSRRDIEENDLKAYLGSDISEDEEAPSSTVVRNADDANGGTKISKKEKERQRLRAALGLQDGPSGSTAKRQAGPVGDMEITFTSALSGSRKEESTLDGDRKETTIEKYVRKEKERKQKRREKVVGARDAKGTDGEAAEDLGFDDPFFGSDGGDRKSTKVSASNRKANRQRRDEEVEGDKAMAQQKRAELELLMMEDDNLHQGAAEGEGLSQRPSHFDINEIVRAEKEARRKRKRKGKPELSAAQQDGFEMDAQDARFAALYDRAEYAIDPTNPRYRDTQAMRALLEEGRRRRRNAWEDDDKDEGASGSRMLKKHETKKRAGTVERAQEEPRRQKRPRLPEGGDEDGGQDEDIQRLVQKVKQRSKGKSRQT